MSDKPHKGRIQNWSKRMFNKDAYLKMYPGEEMGLSYVIIGDFVDHPQFKDTRGHTSWIVSHDEATGEVETRNSRYTLLNCLGKDENPLR